MVLIGPGDFIVSADKGTWSPNQVAKGVGEVLRYLLRTFPDSRVMLALSLPARPLPQAPLRHLVDKTNRILAATDFGPRVTLVDFSAILLGPNGYQKPGAFVDGLHPSAQSYELMSQILVGHLDAVLRQAQRATLLR